MIEEKKRSAVKASISVPPSEQPQFDVNRTALMKELESLNKKMSFSNFVRLVIAGWNLENKEDGLYLTVKL